MRRRHSSLALALTVKHSSIKVAEEEEEEGDSNKPR